MGCGESKHAVATAEPVKKSSTSRSSSRRMDRNLGQKGSTKTKTSACSTPVENEMKESNRVISKDDVVVEKTELDSIENPMKEEEKKAVVVVGHERTMSKGSPGTDYYSEEAKSEYESPQHDVVFAAKEGGESKKDGNEEKKMQGEKVRKKRGEMKDEKKMELGQGDMQEQMKTKENAQVEKDRVEMICEEKKPTKQKQDKGANDNIVAVVGEAGKDERAVAITEKEKKNAEERLVSPRTAEEQVAEENIKEAMRGITL